MHDGISLFERVLKENLVKDTRFLFRRKSYVPQFMKFGRQLNRQGKIRKRLLKTENLTVPPIMILSITNDCNLSCAGCYACAQDRAKKDELTIGEIERVIREASDIGVAIVMVAGGEPLMKKGILDVLGKFENLMFVVFTNGLLIRDENLARIKAMKNVVCAVSLEGGKETTDARRGKGVYDGVAGSMQRMDESDVLFGVSITLTRQNYAEVMDEAFLLGLQDLGAGLTFLIEYVPCQGDEDLCLTEAQKADLDEKTERLNNAMNMLLIPLPGEEDRYSGCLAAGRGFLHISSTGSLEACPFAPYSDANVKEMPLKGALKSRLLTEIRDNHHLLKEGKGGCTLTANKAWVEDLKASLEG